MPVLTKFISQNPEDYGAALQISGFYISNESPSYPNKEPLPFDGSLPLFTGGSGINSQVRVASGEFFIDNPKVNWHLVNPANDSVFSPADVYSSTAFRGFEVNLRDETGRLIEQLDSGSRDTFIELDTHTIADHFENYEVVSSGGIGQYTSRRRFQLEVVSQDYTGRKNTGIYFLTSPSPDITGADVNIGDNISFNFLSTKASGLKRLDVFAAAVTGFTIKEDPYAQSGLLSPDLKYRFNLQSFDQQSLNVDITPPADSGYFYAAVAYDNFGTGLPYYYPSSIKPFTIDPLLYNVRTSGLEGRVVVERDSFNKVVNTQVVGKFLRDLAPGKTKYEVKVSASGGLFNESDSLIVENPDVKGVARFLHGTGTGRIDKSFFSKNSTLQDYAYSGSAATPIFSPYQTTGIQWLDHTLVLNQSDNLPPGFHTGQAPVEEVIVAAGNIESPRVYWGVLMGGWLLDICILGPIWGFLPEGFR